MALLSAGATALVKPATSPILHHGPDPQFVLLCTGVAMGSKSKECARTIHRVEVSDVADEDVHIEVVLCYLVVPHGCGPEDETLPGGNQETAGGSYIGIGAVRTGCLHM